MYKIYFFILQIDGNHRADVVLKTGVVVLIICTMIVCAAIWFRSKKNYSYEKKKLIDENFDRELLKNRVEVQEATFTGIAVELHDNVGQLMSSALMLVNLAERDLVDVPPNLSAAAEALRRAIAEMRSLSKSLNKDWLKQFDFSQNLITEINRFGSNDSLKIEVDIPEENLPLTSEQQFLLFRIVQEGIQNAWRHAQADSLKIDVIAENDVIQVFLKDNGRGFKIRSATNGIGISNMEQRALAMGGTVRWLSGQRGTTVIINLPLHIIK